MISCTDTIGKITPIRFRFVDRDGERVTVLESATTQEDLLSAWHSFDFDRLTWDERDSLDRKSNNLRDKLRGYRNKLDTDYDRANFCHGGDLDDDD